MHSPDSLNQLQAFLHFILIFPSLFILLIHRQIFTFKEDLFSMRWISFLDFFGFTFFMSFPMLILTDTAIYDGFQFGMLFYCSFWFFKDLISFILIVLCNWYAFSFYICFKIFPTFSMCWGLLVLLFWRPLTTCFAFFILIFYPASISWIVEFFRLDSLKYWFLLLLIISKLSPNAHLNLKWSKSLSDF